MTREQNAVTHRIALASDHAGYDLKSVIAEALAARPGVAVLDLGPMDATRCDYPDYAKAVAKTVQSRDVDFGILVCGSGIGVSIAANRFSGVRAALASNATTARLSREHNDANVLCLGSRLVGEVIALEAVDAFLNGQFAGGRHLSRIKKIDIEEAN
ncbi:MAG: ribose 5-phosphate isomerase B [Myxococcota bacterium]|nr:ribose 5-phosphate isomerase B [Myxococcota bacterium]